MVEAVVVLFQVESSLSFLLFLGQMKKTCSVFQCINAWKYFLLLVSLFFLGICSYYSPADVGWPGKTIKPASPDISGKAMYVREGDLKSGRQRESRER